jgi:hypothetical protein
MWLDAELNRPTAAQNAVWLRASVIKGHQGPERWRPREPRVTATEAYVIKNVQAAYS